MEKVSLFNFKRLMDVPALELQIDICCQLGLSIDQISSSKQSGTLYAEETSQLSEAKKKGRPTVGKREQRRLRQVRRNKQRLFIFAALLIASIGLGVMIFITRTIGLPMSSARLQDNPSVGPSNPAVTITEFGVFYD